MSPVKPRRLSDALKKRIEYLNKQHMSAVAISKQILAEEDISVTPRAVRLFLRRRAEEIQNGCPTPKRRPQPEKRKLQQEHLDFIHQKMLENDETTAPELQKMLEELFHLKVSITTIKRARSELGWTATSSRYCQIVRDVNKEKRLAYCINFARNKDDMENIIFTDESTIKMQANVRLSFRLRGQRRRLRGIPKHPYQVHVWAGISRRGRTTIGLFTGRMDSLGYQKILSEHLLPFCDLYYPDGYRLYQDNDPKHTSKSTRKWMEDHGVRTIAAPPESPDLNPIELIWADLKYYLRKHVKPHTKAELVTGILRYWASLNEEKINRYINHIYKVVPRVIVEEGRASGY